VTALYGVPIAYIDGIMDSEWGEYPEYLSERVHYLGTQINQALEKAERVLEIKIAPDAWERSRKISQPFRDNLVRLVKVMKADPVPISLVELELLEALSGSSTGRGLKEGIKAMDILIHELEKRVEAGVGVTEKGAPRVMVRLGHTSDPRVTRLIEDAGLAVPLTFILGSWGGVKVKPKGYYETPGEIIADYEMAGGYYHGTEAQIRFYEKAAELMKLDGFIAQYLYNCRPVATISHIQKKYLEEKTGLPVLSLEIDNFDSRAYSADSLRTKVETFAEMLRARKEYGDVNGRH
jgi:benzoyl-CoA reductase/2-hydroxyglutaryl-CoA dehydratase subunit BcrC/BadD/HgdB